MAFLIFSIKFKPLEAARPLNVIMKSKHGATKLSIPYDRALVPPSRDPCTYIPAQCLPYLKKTELYLCGDIYRGAANLLISHVYF